MGMHDSPTRRRLLLASVAVAALVAGVSGARQEQGLPTFKAGVDLVRLDVTVVSKDGTPVSDLDAADFEVKVDGKARPVQSIRFLDFTPARQGGLRGSSLAAVRDYSSNDSGLSGRLVVFVADEESLPAGIGRKVLESAETLLKDMGPDDRAGLIAIPQPDVRVDFTRDMDVIRRGLLRVTGRWPLKFRQFRLGFDEAIAFEQRDAPVMQRAIERECSYRTQYDACPADVAEEARQVVHLERERAQKMLTALSGLTSSLAAVEGPKTLVLFSAGVPYENAILSRYREFARNAAEARVNLYTLHVDSFSFDPADTASSAAFQPDVDSNTRGLDTLTGLAGGVLFKAVGRAEGVFERIARESTGSYVLGVEPASGTSVTKPLSLSIRVKRPGLIVRTSQQVVPPKRAAWPSAKDAIGYTLRQPRAATEFPLRLTTYTVRGTDMRRLKTIIAAEVDLDVVSPESIAWGYEIVEGERIVSDSFNQGFSTPISRSGGRPVLITAASLPPGEYLLRFAVLDGVGRRSSLEHPLLVGLRQAGDVHFSDLVLGQSTDVGFQPRLNLSVTQSLGAMVELYAMQAASLDPVSVEFDLRAMDGTSRGARRVEAPEGETATVRAFETRLPLDRLRPGNYELRATLLAQGKPIGMVRRGFEVSP